MVRCKSIKSHIEHQLFIPLTLKIFLATSIKQVTRCLKDFLNITFAREIAVASTVKSLSVHSGNTFYLLVLFNLQIIASLCLHKSRLSKYLYNLNKLGDVIVSVYMDDIIISGNDFLFLQKSPR